MHVSTERPQLEPLSISRLIGISLVFFGIQFAWAVEIAFGTTLFLEHGITQAWVNLVWIAGPVTGFIVQPLVGVLSDRCALKMGRRRPWIIGGTAIVVAAMAALATLEAVGGNSHPVYVVVLAVLAFWVLDLGLNTIQGPCRALLVDLAPPEQQDKGNAVFSAMLGLGNFAGYGLGAINLVAYAPFSLLKSNIQALFLLSCIVLLICLVFTSYFAREAQFCHSDRDAPNALKRIVLIVAKMPRPLARVCMVLFFAWVGFFAFIIYASAWMGESIAHGDPAAASGTIPRERYDAGVREASLGLAAYAVVTSAVSALVPVAIKWIGSKAVFCVCLCIEAVALFLPICVSTFAPALVTIALFGFPRAAVMTIPFSIVGRSSIGKDSGLLMGTLNIFVVIPQLLVSLSFGIFVSLFKGSLIAPLAAGGVFALIGSAFTWRLDTREHVDDSHAGYEQVVDD